ncbi:MAG: histidinol-phosphatase HisJ family protein [Ruminococcaceae bacterium]|nr:histidinol-phosphatase HisJ family protein [Oscillospiraceae bacterium]
MNFSPFHTHTTFCDGKNTAEEMVKKAIELGLSEIGFSSHSFTEHDSRWCMSKEGEGKYKDEILRLKDKYSDKIKIFLGIEYDYYSNTDISDYDYVIGSVHYVKKDSQYIALDESAKILKNAIKELYNGDADALAEDYYNLVGDLYNKTSCHIVGHFDLITKFQEREKVFDTNSKRYRKSALDACRNLLKSPVTFEVNTGAISRGYRTSFYPEEFILSEIVTGGGKLVITTDTHKTDTINSFVEDAENLLIEKNYPFFTTMEEILTHSRKNF